LKFGVANSDNITVKGLKINLGQSWRVDKCTFLTVIVTNKQNNQEEYGITDDNALYMLL
jgi:hypothetical protein